MNIMEKSQIADLSREDHICTEKGASRKIPLGQGRKQRPIRISTIMLKECARKRPTAAMQKISTILQRHCKIPVACIWRYMNTVLTSITGHAANTWVHRLWQRVKLEEQVKISQREVLVRLTAAFNTICIETVCIGIGIMLMYYLEVSKQAALYW